MLIVFIWLSLTGAFPQHYKQTIKKCQQYPKNQCIILQQVHRDIYFQKYRSLLKISQERLQSLSISETVDLLRLLYLFEKGGIYSDLDSNINYQCLYQLIKSTNQTFFFGQEQGNNQFPSNYFIYSALPKNQKLKQVIQKIHQCENCTDLYFNGPFFLRNINAPFLKVGSCIRHNYEGTWKRGDPFKRKMKIIFTIILWILILYCFCKAFCQIIKKCLTIFTSNKKDFKQNHQIQDQQVTMV